MNEPRRSFRRVGAEQRKEALINATLMLMANGGPEAVTIRAIADEAEVTQGLIRHYFSSKEALINAAYERHMALMETQVCLGASQEQGSARQRLLAFVQASLRPPVVDSKAVALWAGFIHMIRKDGRMRSTHQRTYFQFRDHLEGLIAEAMHEAGRAPDATTLRHYAIACNAVLDGLWLEGSALPDAFAADELVTIGGISIGAILNLSLDPTETRV